MKKQKLYKKRIPWWLDIDFFKGYWKNFTTRQSRRRAKEDIRSRLNED
mgnify:CR=1 FL=1